jgi:SAM-dependent methyltransferase
VRVASDTTYVEHVAALERRLGADEALRIAVGGEFVAVGKLEYYLLRSLGLTESQFVVDVGCGSGRLAAQLSAFPTIKYVGCDVVPRLLSFARDICQRDDWRFVETTGTVIPCPEGVADFVCFFSVFTHLRQEDIFRYLCEARRVLRPGGLVIASFLEFRVGFHWQTFAESVDGTRNDSHLNQFIERDAIRAWAAHSGFDIAAFHGGDATYIPVPEEVRFDSGKIVSGSGSLGQSVVILKKIELQPDVPNGIHPGKSVESDDFIDHSIPEEKRRFVAPATRPVAPLINVSVRANVRADEAVTIGFIVGGQRVRRLLLRAVGPSLAAKGIRCPLSNPRFEVYAGANLIPESSPVQESDTWGLFTSLGAFIYQPGSKDVARVIVVPPGAYTAIVRGGSPSEEGEVLLEVYYID